NGDGLDDAQQGDVTTAPMVSANDFNNAATGQTGDLTHGYGALIGGDNNSDGRPDEGGSIQLSNVTVTAVGLSGNGLMLQQLSSQGLGAATDVINFTAAPATGQNSNTGDVGFTDADPNRDGIQTRVTIVLGGNGIAATQVMKIDANGNSFDFTVINGDVDGGQLIDLNNDGKIDRIILTLTDNARGDLDPRVGIITDPVFLAKPNVAPSITSLGGADVASLSLTENSVTVGTVTAVDEDGDPVIYSLSGGTDLALFSINADTGVLSFATNPDFEGTGDNRYEVTVRVTDAGSLFDEQALTVTITDINEAPTAVVLTSALDNNTVAEISDTSNRLKVADIAIRDDALGSPTTTLSGMDAARFETEAGALYLKAGTVLDHEVQTSYDVRVTVLDAALNGAAPVSADYRLNVADVNEAPTAITLSANTLMENTPVDTAIGLLVGSLGLTDDALGNNQLSLEGADATSFRIDDSRLVFVGTSPNFEAKPSYQLSVKSTDGTLTHRQTFTVHVSDANDTPTATATVPEQSVQAGQIFDLRLPSDLFQDQDTVHDDQLVLSAALADGSALPTWLSFDAATARLSGQVDATANGQLALRITATDRAGALAQVDVVVNIRPLPVVSEPNPAPVVSPSPTTPIAEVDPLPPFSFVPTMAPAQVDLSAFNPLAPGESPVWDTLFQMLETQALQFTRAEGFQVRVSPGQAEGQTGLFVSGRMNDLNLQASGGSFELQIPRDLFNHTRSDVTVALLATQASGAPLPSWVRFDPVRGVFFGTAPAGLKADIEVKLVARDSLGNEVTSTFKLKVGQDSKDGKANTAQADRQPGKASLSVQLAGARWGLKPLPNDPLSAHLRSLPTRHAAHAMTTRTHGA
ncbi:MAG: putative Ig domain-containing protein, partial [Rhodoferax sp.]|uniref:putative Ig domain-containing protein n=1 Tax=Rhodoferax sp. TaxID=50421 RepID=UPI002736B413